MQLTIPKKMKCGSNVIPAGDYMVTLNRDTAQIALIGAGRDFQLLGTKRPGKRQVRMVTATFVAGEPTSTICVAYPPKFELVVFLQVVKEEEKAKE